MQHPESANEDERDTPNTGGANGAPEDERGSSEEGAGSTEDQSNPEHPDEQATLKERADGAHAEQVTDEANLRADPDAPGVNRGASDHRGGAKE